MKLSKEIIDIIESKKINIEEIKTKYEELIDCFRMKVWLKKDVKFDKKTYREILNDSDDYIDERAYELISIPWKYLKSNETSFISPAFNFNQLVSTYRRYLENLDVHFPDSHIEFYEFFCAIHTCLISIKSGIDRLVKLFSYYYNDIPKNITFGHVKQNGKYTNFLSKANEKKGKFPIFKYVMAQYEGWIKESVAPRDDIIHYNDILQMTSKDERTGLYEPKGLSKSSNETIDIRLIKYYVNCFYNFIDDIFDYFLFETNMITKCDFYGVVLKKEEVEKYLEDDSFNPLDIPRESNPFEEYL